MMMEPRTLKFIAESCQAPLLHANPDAMVTRICTDSRTAQRGDLFLALSGERFDAHAFLDDVAEKGVTAIVADSAKVPQGFAYGMIPVPNTRWALGQIASVYRQQFELPIVAVAGSNGKTTTKELLASVLGQRGPTLSSQASFNNDVGVPLTLLGLEARHRAAVLEVGTNHPGELAPLLDMVRPRFGVITSIGREHLEFLGNLEGVAQEEGTVAEILPKDGVLFINGETSFASEIARRCRGRVVRVGFGRDMDFCARDIRVHSGGVDFRVKALNAQLDGEYRINLLGRHQVTNALLAMAVADELGLSIGEIAVGLAACKPPLMRMQVIESDGFRLLNDTYNANADSTLAALQTLSDLPCDGCRVAILGDMEELGDHTLPAHAEIGKRAAELGIDQLLAVGKMAAVMASSARAGGLSVVKEFADVSQLMTVVRSLVKRGDLVLLKASRTNQMERVTEVLRGQQPT